MRCYLCLDDRNGLSFNGRRESRDKRVIEDIVKEVKSSKKRLLIENYSLELFEDYGFTKEIELRIVEAFDESMGLMLEEADVFTELWSPEGKGFDEYIIYRWNREYPYDKTFEEKLEEKFKLIETVDFVGTSHEKITKEIWKK